MWETWILREAWDKGSLEVEAVLYMLPLQSGSDKGCLGLGTYAHSINNHVI